MAKEANAPVIVLAPNSQPNGRYQLDASDPIWMESREDLDSEIIHNANRVLAHTEEIIRKYAHQWEMFYPIWPEFLGI
jgi:lauroyl/myristoyl acyltransferase